MKFIRCNECLLPSTKPDIVFDQSGVCSACLSFRQRAYIDWKSREQDFLRHFQEVGAEKAWDCVVPVSGGKDSTYQVLKLKSLGLRPLAVTATTCDLTPIGRKNLENLRGLGVDLIEVSPNPSVRTRLNRLGLEEVGDISWPEHLSIFTIPVTLAIRFGIKIIVWGENPQNEYGGPQEAGNATLLDRRWLEEFGGLLGLRLHDLIDSFGFDRNELGIYEYPEALELEKADLKGLFLGKFFEWNGLSNAILSKAHGFSTPGGRVRGSLVDYENLDNHQAGIHDYFKYLKFGFGRTTDIASNLIRRGIISRQDGLDLVSKFDGEYPSEYMGKSLADILAPLDMSIPEFDIICDRFTNEALFASSPLGSIERRPDGSPRLRTEKNK